MSLFCHSTVIRTHQNASNGFKQSATKVSYKRKTEKSWCKDKKNPVKLTLYGNNSPTEPKLEDQPGEFTQLGIITHRNMPTKIPTFLKVSPSQPSAIHLPATDGQKV